LRSTLGVVCCSRSHAETAMIGLIYDGLKMAYRAYKDVMAFSDKLGAFQEEGEDLQERIDCVYPCVLRLEGKLTEDLLPSLNAMKRILENSTRWVKTVVAFVESHPSGTPFKLLTGYMKSKLAGAALAIEAATHSKAVDDMIDKFGGVEPKDKFDKLAVKFESAVNILSLTVGTQMLTDGQMAQVKQQQELRAAEPQDMDRGEPKKGSSKIHPEPNPMELTKDVKKADLGSVEMAVANLVDDLGADDSKPDIFVLRQKRNVMIFIFKYKGKKWIIHAEDNRVLYWDFYAFLGISNDPEIIKKVSSTKKGCCGDTSSLCIFMNDSRAELYLGWCGSSCEAKKSGCMYCIYGCDTPCRYSTLILPCLVCCTESIEVQLKDNTAVLGKLKVVMKHVDGGCCGLDGNEFMVFFNGAQLSYY